MQCVGCGGKGCGNCAGTGSVTIEACPRRLLTAPYHALFRQAAWADKGHLPVAGGALDQTEWFLQACDLIWADSAAWKAKLGVIDDG